MNQLICPISSQQINENASRVTASVIAILVILFIVTQNVWILTFVLFDFSFRIFKKVKFSPVSCFVRRFYNLAKLPTKLVDKAPKVFAARLGFLMTVVSFGLFFFLPLTATIIAGVLAVFILADALFNFCIGCIIYHYLIFPLYDDNSKEPPPAE
ncbi:MAG: DUF4395 domain-containing protein [Bacteroidales bacterium]|nr:DUF4395 domain-containing protein [Bacteroidales bacterium]